MKFISYAKKLSLIGLAFLSLSACSPKEKSIDIKSLIPEDSKIAFYFGTNQEVLKELKAQSEYGEIISAIKTANAELENLYTQIAKELAPKEKEILELFINPKDIIGSLENILLNQNISLAYSQGSIMEALMQTKSPSLLLSLKVPDTELASAIEKSLELIPQVAKVDIQGYSVFKLEKIQNSNDLFICKAHDVFLATMSKESLDAALLKIDNPSKSILDNKDFKALISDSNSDIFAYVDISDMANLLALVAPQVNISDFKSVGIQGKTLSLTEGVFSLRLNCENSKYLSTLSFDSFKESSEPKNIYKDSILYASAVLPTQKSLASIARLLGFNDYAKIIEIDAFNIKSADIAIERQAFENFDKKPKMLSNSYVGNSESIINMLGLPVSIEINGIKVYSPTKEMKIAKVSKERISTILNSDKLEENIEIISSNKVNDYIKAKLDEISVENCILDLYIDAKFFQALSDASYADSDGLPFKIPSILAEKSSEIYEENSLVAKLGIKENIITLTAKSKSKINYKVAKELILELFKN